MARRHESLIPLSHQHHDALLLAWRSSGALTVNRAPLGGFTAPFGLAVHPNGILLFVTDPGTGFDLLVGRFLDNAVLGFDGD